jgi:hypothetical protein
MIPPIGGGGKPLGMGRPSGANARCLQAAKHRGPVPFSVRVAGGFSRDFWYWPRGQHPIFGTVRI